MKSLQRDFVVRIERGFQTAEDFRELVRRSQRRRPTWCASATWPVSNCERRDAQPVPRQHGIHGRARHRQAEQGQRAEVSRRVQAEIDC
jgi:hypothetical protein